MFCFFGISLLLVTFLFLAICFLLFSPRILSSFFFSLLLGPCAKGNITSNKKWRKFMSQKWTKKEHIWILKPVGFWTSTVQSKPKYSLSFSTRRTHLTGLLYFYCNTSSLFLATFWNHFFRKLSSFSRKLFEPKRYLLISIRQIW